MSKVPTFHIAMNKNSITTAFSNEYFMVNTKHLVGDIIFVRDIGLKRY